MLEKAIYLLFIPCSVHVRKSLIYSQCLVFMLIILSREFQPETQLAYTQGLWQHYTQCHPSNQTNYGSSCITRIDVHLSSLSWPNTCVQCTSYTAIHRALLLRLNKLPVSCCQVTFLFPAAQLRETCLHSGSGLTEGRPKHQLGS